MNPDPNASLDLEEPTTLLASLDRDRNPAYPGSHIPSQKKDQKGQASLGTPDWSSPLTQWGSHQPFSPSQEYLHYATFQLPTSTLPGAISDVAATQEANRNQLDEVLVLTQGGPPADVITTFVYDGDGGRVMKKVDGLVTVYIGHHYVCHGSEQAVTNGDPLACAKVIFANGQRVAMVQVDTGNTSYFHQDHLGSTSLVTDGAGVVEQELGYYPFGATRVTTGSADVAYKYTGQEFDSSTDLYFYQARYYDPHLGRFISADTIVPKPFNSQSLNRYSYVLNNPLNYVDPTGFLSEPLTDEELGEIVINPVPIRAVVGTPEDLAPLAGALALGTAISMGDPTQATKLLMGVGVGVAVLIIGPEILPQIANELGLFLADDVQSDSTQTEEALDVAPGDGGDLPEA